MCTANKKISIYPSTNIDFTVIDPDIGTHASPKSDNQADIHASKQVCLVPPSKDSIKISLDISSKVGVGDNPEFPLNNLREKNLNRLIIAHLNITFIANKFEALRTFVVGKIDILLISETKIDESFPLTQFTLEGFSTLFRADRNSQGGGLIIYIRDDIPSKEIKVKNYTK